MTATAATPPGPIRFQGWRKFNRNPPLFMYALLRQYGDVARWRGIFDLYFVNHPDYARRVLSASFERFDKQVIDYRVLEQIMGNGLVSNDGPDWVKQRKLMQPMFANRVVNGFDVPINRLTAHLLESWDRATEPVWVDRDMGRLTFQIVGATLFGSDIDEHATEVADILEVVNLQTQEMRALMTLYPWIPTPHNIRWRRARRRLDDIVFGMIERRRADGAQRNDILDRLLAARDENGAPMDDRQMRDEVVTLMLAGHETSATALAWTVYLLARHPEVEARLFAELDGALSGAPATSSDLSKVPWLKQVVQESMRIYPPVWAIARRSRQDERFGDYDVPAGSYVTIAPYALHRHAEFWPDPERFDPARFDARERRHSYCYLPFAAGPRACIGLGMAMLEIQLVLAQIVQRYRLHVVPEHPVDILPKVTLKQRFGMPIRLERR